MGQRLNSDCNTNEKTRNILFTFISYFSAVFLRYNHEKCEPIKHSHNRTENNVNWNICQGKTRAKYSRFRYDGKSGEIVDDTCAPGETHNELLASIGENQYSFDTEESSNGGNEDEFMRDH